MTKYKNEKLLPILIRKTHNKVKILYIFAEQKLFIEILNKDIFILKSCFSCNLLIFI